MKKVRLIQRDGIFPLEEKVQEFINNNYILEIHYSTCSASAYRHDQIIYHSCLIIYEEIKE